MPKIVKPAGKNASNSRKLTMHGSKHERGYFKIDGKLRRNDEKPGFFHKGRRP
jgi:hypothetical protein